MNTNKQIFTLSCLGKGIKLKASKYKKKAFTCDVIDNLKKKKCTNKNGTVCYLEIEQRIDRVREQTTIKKTSKEYEIKAA